MTLEDAVADAYKRARWCNLIHDEEDWAVMSETLEQLFTVLAVTNWSKPRDAVTYIKEYTLPDTDIYYVCSCCNAELIEDPESCYHCSEHSCDYVIIAKKDTPR